MSKERVNSQPQQFLPLPRAQVIVTLSCVLLTMFLAALDQTIVSTATPRIIADLGGFDRYTWITTGYLVASTTAAPIVGRLSDMYGRKWFFVGSVFVFIIGSILCGISHDMTQLILFRVLQGLGGGTIMAVTFIVIADLFPPEERGKYMGMLAACFGLSSVIGPTLGGFLTDNLSWHWVFFVNVPLAGPVIFLLIKYFPDNQGATDPIKRRIDYVGMILLIISVVGLMIGLSWGGVQYGWGSPQVVSALSIGVVASAVLIVVELKAPNPTLELALFRERMVSIGLVLTLLTGFAMFGAIIFVPLYFQGVLGASATSSGTFLTPMMLGVVFGATLSGQVLSRTGGHFRIQSLVGIFVLAVGVFLFTTLGNEASFVRAVVYIVILGFGLGSTFPTLTIAVQNFTPPESIGAATSLTQFARTIGGLIGLSTLGSVLSSRFVARVESDIDQAGIVVPQAVLENLKSNPRALVDSEAGTAMLKNLGLNVPSDTLVHVVGVMKGSLSGAIDDVFNVSLIVLLVSLAVTVLLNKTGFRKRDGPESQA